MVGPSAGEPGPTLEDCLLEEITGDTLEPSVAYRGGQRWVEQYEKMPLKKPSASLLKEGGTYLITGGLGGVGLILAEFLARNFKAKLVLTGRSPLPEREAWDALTESGGSDQATLGKIQAVRALEARGAEVLVLSADAADQAAMSEVFQKVRDRFGALHGVVHAAGILDQDTFKPMRELVQADFERQFKPKRTGLMVLANLLRGTPVEFCLLTSSLSAVLGGLGYGAYAAGNLYMDVFARRENRAGGCRWISVNWDAWRRPAADEEETGLEKAAIKPQEGGEAFHRILSTRRIPQVVVSAHSLQSRINQWIRLAEIRPKTIETASVEPAHDRPDLATDFAAPSTAVEKKIAGIWKSLLGVDRVGVNDHFLEMGGHSLLAVQMNSRIRDSFQVQLPLNIVLDNPTVARLAELVGRQQESQVDDQTLQQLVDEISQLPEDEVQSQLASEKGGSTP